MLTVGITLLAGMKCNLKLYGIRKTKYDKRIQFTHVIIAPTVSEIAGYVDW